MAEPVVVISFDLWRRAFGSDRAAIGETILLDGTPAVVIGVTPPEYRGFYVDSGLGFSVPLSFLNRRLGSDPKRPVRGLNAVGRLALNVTIDQARGALDAAWPAVRVETVPAGLNPTEQAEIPKQRIQLESLASGFSTLRRQYGEPLLIVSGLAAALLLLGCINLAGLLLARTTARQHQLAVQLTLGASRSRLARQLLLESLLLSGLGAAIGLVLAWWATTIATRWLWPNQSPLALTLTPDRRVVIVAVGIACATAVLVTMLPAFTIAKRRALAVFQSGRTVTASAGGWTKVLLATQVAMSLVLLVGALLLTTSLLKLRNMPTGLEHDGLRWSRLFAVPNGYRDLNDEVYYPDLTRRLSEVPGVRSVALATIFPTYLPFENLLTYQRVAITGTDAAGETDALMERVTPGFFETVGIPLVRGRDFTWMDDKQHSEVAIISESLRRVLFPTEDPIGRRIRIGKEPSRSGVEIVGVASDALIGGFKQSHKAVVFRSRMQDALSPRAPVVLFRTAADPAAVDAAVASVITGRGHEYARMFYSLDGQIDITLVRERLLAGLSSFFAGLAVLIAFVGLYSAMALAVSRRTRELGIRIALGASHRSIIRMVMAESAMVAGVGSALGMLGAIGASGFMASWIFGVQPTDATTLVGAAAFFVGIGLVAGLRPALRAASVDPATALRTE